MKQQYSSEKNKEFYEHDSLAGGENMRHEVDQYGISGDTILNFTRYLVYIKFQLGKVAEWMNKKGGDVLDLGCGDALILRYEKGITSYTGLDISKSRIEYDKKTYKDKRFSFYEDEILSPTTKLKKYDTVLLNEIIEHVPDARELLKISGRYIKKGGYLIVSTPLESRYLEGIGKVHEDKHIRVFSALGLKKMIQEEGYTIEEMYVAGFQLNYTVTMVSSHPLLRLYKRVTKAKKTRKMPFEMKKFRIGLLDSKFMHLLYSKKTIPPYLLEGYFNILTAIANRLPFLGEQVVIIAKKS